MDTIKTFILTKTFFYLYRISFQYPVLQIACPQGKALVTEKKLSQEFPVKDI